MKIRQTLPVLLAVLGLIGLSACGGGPTPTPTAKDAGARSQSETPQHEVNAPQFVGTWTLDDATGSHKDVEADGKKVISDVVVGGKLDLEKTGLFKLDLYGVSTDGPWKVIDSNSIELEQGDTPMPAKLADGKLTLSAEGTTHTFVKSSS